MTTIADAMRLVASGWSPTQASSRCGIKRHTLYRHMKREGIKTCNRCQSPADIMQAAIDWRRRRRGSWSMAAKKFELHVDTLRTYARSMSMLRRKPKKEKHRRKEVWTITPASPERIKILASRLIAMGVRCA